MKEDSLLQRCRTSCSMILLIDNSINFTTTSSNMKTMYEETTLSLHPQQPILFLFSYFVLHKTRKKRKRKTN